MDINTCVRQRHNITFKEIDESDEGREEILQP